MLKLWMIIEKRLLLTLAAANAMQALMEKQQDLNLDMAPATLQRRYTETASLAVGFAQALWQEISKT